MMKHFFFLFLLGITCVLLVTVFQGVPGYMDADYYYAIGLRLFQGHGFSEPFIWNFLDNPAGIPHPSNAYWMPLSSIMAFFGMLFAGHEGFEYAKIFFLIIAGFIPVVTAALAIMISGKKSYAWIAGILACISPFYLPYLGTTDSFGIAILLGGLWLLVIASENQISPYFRGFLLGVLSGLMHLARADGIIWLGVSFIAGLFQFGQGEMGKKHHPLMVRVFILFCCLMGYLAIAGPWLLRNYLSFGTLFSPGGLQTIWLTEYDELYSYPATLISVENWLHSGVGNIIQDRLYALWINLQTSLAVQGGIFLLPLILVGLWQNRKTFYVRMGLIGWLTTFIVMSFVFPFTGWRGGFFHSGAFTQSLWWVMVPFGFDRFIEWGVNTRKWDQRQARRIFMGGMFSIAAILSLMVARNRVVGDDIEDPVWTRSQIEYRQLNQALINLGVDETSIILVNNSPGFYNATGRSAISIPNGPIQSTIQVATKYGGDYLLLERNHPRELMDLYNQPQDLAGLDYLTTTNQTHIFRFVR